MEIPGNSAPDVHLAGDQKTGLTSMRDLTDSAYAKFDMYYEGKYAHPFPMKKVSCELYKAGDHLTVVTLCPRCRKAQRITSDNKEISFDLERKQLFIERFTCPWELDGEAGRMEFQMSLCNAKLVYAGNQIRDDR